MRKIKLILKQKPYSNVAKYPSAEFLYSVSLADYNREISNYDRIYDRINIALSLCSAVTIYYLSTVNFKAFFEWQNFSQLEKVALLLYAFFTLTSLILMIISIIQLLVLSRSKEMLTFDSNCIKTESLYEESLEDSSLWVTLQYIRVINDVSLKTQEKQKGFNLAITLIVISILCFAFSIIVNHGGLS